MSAIKANCLCPFLFFFFFFIRNEEEYINRRTETGETKEAKEREKTKGRMRGPSYTN